VSAETGRIGAPANGVVCEWRRLEDLRQLESGELGGLPVDGVDLVQRDDDTRELEQPGDREMLACLRPDPLVGRDHQQEEADAAEPRKRVVQEALVPGDVDEGERQVGAVARGARARGEMRETEVEGDAASLFLFEAIAVDAGEGADQRRLAVIDVPRGADEDRLHRLNPRPGARASAVAPRRHRPSRRSGRAPPS
jgi:hypothetical protein